jgi:hypothetical protein
VRRFGAAAVALVVAACVVAPLASILTVGWWGPVVYVVAGGLTAAVVYGWLVDR